MSLLKSLTSNSSAFNFKPTQSTMAHSSPYKVLLRTACSSSRGTNSGGLFYSRGISSVKVVSISKVSYYCTYSTDNMCSSKRRSRGPVMAGKKASEGVKQEDGKYKHTVDLPKTTFGMRANSSVREPEIQKIWEENQVFKKVVEKNSGANFILHDDPPYANGDLHTGHALNKILKDTTNRYKVPSCFIAVLQTCSLLEMTMEVHQVLPPPHKTTLHKLKTRLKETFFPDDPLRQFKGQPLKTKLILAAQYLFPILQWGPKYTFSLFKSDLVAGLTIASLAIPQGISYAKLANLPPIVGLYSSFVPPLVYAVLGSSRDLAVGPVSIASLVLGSMLRQEVSPTADPVLFLQLAFTSTFFAGLFQASLGILRLGFIIDFLSKAILIGFMAGAAIIVSLQQLKSLLGITHFTNQMGLIPVMTSVFNNIHEWSWQTILMGICFLVLLLLARHVSIKKPKLFWVSAGAPLLCVIISTLLVFAIKGQNHGISVIGKLQQGINPPSWNMLRFHGSHLGLVMKTGLITGILSLTEGIAVGRTFAALKNYKVDGNKEMMAIGFMNVVGSSTSCYVTTGAFSRSAVNNNAGAKTAVSNVVMSVTVMVTLLFLMPLFQYTPNVVLGAIIVTAVIGLIDLPAAYNIWKIDKFDFLVMLSAFMGVLFISVQGGLALAVGLSTFKILMQITRPKTVMLGKIPGTDIYRNLHQYKEAVRVPGFLILSIEAPINFANITYLNERTLRWVEEEEDNIKEQSSLRFLILEMSAVSAIDTSGISLFKELKTNLEKKGVELVLVNPLAEVIEKLKKVDEATDFMHADSLFLTVGEAVASLSSTMKGQSPTFLGGAHTVV